MNRISVEAPEVTAHAATFRWSVAPKTSLYRDTVFTLRFPEDVDLTRVPEGIWWIAAMACLHAHWPLLRPCTVRLPITLHDGARELWSRLLDSEVSTLEAYRGTSDTLRRVEIVEAGPRLPAWAPGPDSGRCASAFSGGKDSLLSAGLLAELTERPVLVTTTSPMPPLEDHLTERRRHVLAEMARRRDVQLVEVSSDYRGLWDNHFGDRLGYPIAVNEVTDTFLYFASLVVAGAALGAPHLFLASEAEVQENVDWNGRVVQHPHYMYSAATQRALQGLLRPAGFRFSSLTSPLRSWQVQHLLWARYRDLSDLQYSCWRVGRREATCSRCSQCFRIALGALAAGHDPGRMGIDLTQLLPAMASWEPRRDASSAGDAPELPRDVVARDLHAQVLRSIAATPVSRVAQVLLAGGPGRLLRPRSLAALRAYASLRRRLRSVAAETPGGFRPGFVRLLDPLLRDRVASIFGSAFDEEEPARYAAVLSRGDALAGWILEPIGGEA